MSWVDDVINETQGDGDQVQHSVPLTWRKTLVRLNTEELHSQYIYDEKGTKKTPFFCSGRRGRPRYLEKEKTFTDC